MRKKVAELGPSEGSVDLLVKVMSAIPKEVETDNGKKQIVYGMLADETGAVPYTSWDMERVSLKPGEVFMLHNAYTKEFGGKVQVNLGNRASAETRGADEVIVDSSVVQTAVSAGGEMVKVAGLQDGMNNVTVTGKILSVESKEVEASGAKKIVYSGMLADETGKVQYLRLARLRAETERSGHDQPGLREGLEGRTETELRGTVRGHEAEG